MLAAVARSATLLAITTSPTPMPIPYDEATAISDVWLNQAVGCSGLANWTCGVACEKVPTTSRLIASNKRKDTLALVGRRSSNECVVVIRGSKNFLNTLEDLDVIPETLPDCDGCRVHSGFLSDWRSLAPQVKQHLDALGCRNGSVEIMGHSLGGAMAVIAAYELSESPSPAAAHTGTSSLRRAVEARGEADAVADAGATTESAGFAWNVRRAYTYGQPRVGTVAFAAALEARLRESGVAYYRVVNYRDAVPHLPSGNLLFDDWAHSGTEVYYNATRLGAYETCTEPDDRRCSAQWNLPQTLTHTCDHCGYLGRNPCDCGRLKPRCDEPQ